VDVIDTMDVERKLVVALVSVVVEEMQVSTNTVS
tara:strand:- start:97 stop:198 length:102 start_codon:yes stop_codon:yes gene_type:complete